ncbi:MAG: hypothetical protein AB4426_08540 [Xenococcaceae cyanobacterium]
MSTKNITNGQLKAYIQSQRAKGLSPQEIVKMLIDQGQATLIMPSDNPDDVEKQVASAIAKLENRQE